MKEKLYIAGCFMLGCLLYGINIQAQIVITVAGSGRGGYGSGGYSGDGGPATLAKLNEPVGTAVDETGNLYIADQRNNCVRKVNSAGIISTFAGNGTMGFSGDGGPATTAQLYDVSDVAVDAAGNLYIADDLHVRKVNAAGIISTIAGTTSTSSTYLGDGGPATAAFLEPIAIAVDDTGNVYIADASNNRIRKINTAGIINTIAGNGAAGYSGDGSPAIAAQITVTYGLAVDRHGNIYISDSNSIRKVDTAGIITTFAGSGISGFFGDGGPAALAQLYAPSGIDVDSSGDVYIADNGNDRIRKVNASGIITTIAGSGLWGFTGDGGPAISAEFDGAYMVSVDGTGSVYISDFENYRIRKIVSDQNHMPHFLHGHSQGITVCENTSADTINTLLTVNDTDIGQTETWSAVTMPAHGTLTAAYSMASTGGIITPAGLYYTPAAGYSGSDSFRVRVTDGVAADTTTVHVTVAAAPAAIGGTIQVCQGSVTNLSDAVTGGTWSSGNTTVATVGTTGIVSGAAPGTSSITYTLGTGCSRSATVTVNPLPAAITGTLTVCAGSSTTLSDATSGGVWSGSGAFAGVTALGVVNGASAGTQIISYTLGTGCARTTTVTVNPLPTITGPTAECVGATMTETGSPTGGTWNSATTSVATIGSTGIVTGVATGTTPITYTSAAGCKATTTITVSLSPTGIIGPSTVCANDTTTLSDAVGGGAWSSGNIAAATIGSLTGIVTGVNSGTTTITYSLGSGCTQTKILTVNAAPAIPIAIGTGGMSVCTGATTTLSDATTGGIWSPATGSIASVSGTGVVTGVAAGTAVIAYTLSGTGCAAAAMVTVNPTPSVIGGIANVCAGATITLSNAITGGIWTSSNEAIASVDSVDNVEGIVAGTATITYSLGAGCAVTRVVTVNPISAITGSTGICLGATTTLSDAATGGTWSSPAGGGIITTGVTTGVITGTGAGAAVVTYTTAAGCTATTTVTVNLAPSVISGTLRVCAGATTTLGNTAGGGTWTSSTTTVATIGTTSGIVTGIIPGTSVITYSLGSGCTVTAIVTVNAAPALITGVIPIAIGICAGAAITWSDATTGGVWSSAPLSVATITGTGTVRGVTAGTAIVSYTLGSGCAATAIVTVNPLPSTITGTMSVCVGLATTLTDATSGGTWSSPDLTVGVDMATGVVTGESAGPATITYTLLTGCTTTTSVVINSAPAPISGATGVCIGSSTTLNDPSGGGTWASSDITTAIVTPSGTVTGIALGTAIISYMVGGCPATAVVTVHSLPAPVGGATSVCAGSAITLTDSSGGGIWSTGSTGIATADMSAGIITGISAGVATVTYSLGAGCTVSATVVVNPVPAAIGGIAEVCAGYTSILSDATGGGVWSSSSTALASITAGGLVTGGVSGGLVTVYYTNPSTGCAATREISVVAVPPISGVSSMCAFGPTMTVADATTGGVWTSTSASVSSAGVVTAYSAGAASITYTLSLGCYTTAAFTIHPEPGPVMGASHFCLGLTTTLSDTTAGGTWSSSGLTVGIGAASGIVTGFAAGTATISYTVATGCTETATITVETFPSAGIITGLPEVCAGAAITLTDTIAGGGWSSPGLTVGVGTTTGIVTGISAGVDTIRYTVSNTCGAATAAKTITVNPLPVAGVITGAATVCTGSSITLSDAAAGGAWSVSNASATVSGGIVSALSTGVDTIKYSVTNSCGTADTATVITISTLPDPGAISGGIDSLCSGLTIPLLDTATGGTWSVSNGHISITGAGLLTALTPGIDTITYSIINSCGTVTTSVAVTVKAASAADTITGNTTVCIGATDTLTGTPPGGMWYSSNGNAVIAPTSTGAIISGGSAGVDTIIYTTVNDCGGAAAAYVLAVIDCKEQVAPSGSPQGGGTLRVFPNPNDGVFTVILSSGIDEAVQVTITDIAGQKMKEFTTTTNKAADIKFDAASGIYFLSAVTAHGTYVVKVTVE